MRRIYTAMRGKAFDKAKELYGEESDLHKDSDGLERSGYSEKWMGSFVFHFAHKVKQDNSEAFETALHDSNFKKDPTERLNSEQVSPDRAYEIFKLLSKAQSNISAAECLYEFLVFCESKSYDLSVLGVEGFNLSSVISDLKQYIETTDLHIKAKRIPWKSENGFEFTWVDDVFDIKVCQADETFRSLDIPDLRAHRKIENYESLLSWQYQLTEELIGREEELSLLEAWLKLPLDRSIQLIYGEGGVGKTRLAFHFAQEIRAKGWQCGQCTGDLPGKWISGDEGIVVIIDYPEENPKKVSKFLRAVRKMPDSRKEIHVLLLSRNRLFLESITEEAAGLIQTRPIHLEYLKSKSDQQALFSSAWEKLKELKFQPVEEKQDIAIPITEKEFNEWLDRVSAHATPLIVIALAFYLLEEGKKTHDELLDLQPAVILRYMSKREEKRIKNEVEGYNRRIDVMPKIEYQGVLLIKAMAVLTGGFDESLLELLSDDIEQDSVHFSPPSTKHLKQMSIWNQEGILALKPDVLAADLFAYCLEECAKTQEIKWTFAAIGFKRIEDLNFDSDNMVSNFERFNRTMYDAVLNSDYKWNEQTYKIDMGVLHCIWLVKNLTSHYYGPWFHYLLRQALIEVLQHPKGANDLVDSQFTHIEKAQYALYLGKILNDGGDKEHAMLFVEAGLNMFRDNAMVKFGSGGDGGRWGRALSAVSTILPEVDSKDLLEKYSAPLAIVLSADSFGDIPTGYVTLLLNLPYPPDNLLAAMQQYILFSYYYEQNSEAFRIDFTATCFTLAALFVDKEELQRNKKGIFNNKDREDILKLAETVNQRLVLKAKNLYLHIQKKYYDQSLEEQLENDDISTYWLAHASYFTKYYTCSPEMTPGKTWEQYEIDHMVISVRVYIYYSQGDLAEFGNDLLLSLHCLMMMYKMNDDKPNLFSTVERCIQFGRQLTKIKFRQYARHCCDSLIDFCFLFECRISYVEEATEIYLNSLEECKRREWVFGFTDKLEILALQARKKADEWTANKLESLFLKSLEARDEWVEKCW